MISAMPVNVIFIMLIVIISLLPGCESSQVAAVRGVDCSCIDYLPARPRPNWVGADSSLDMTYLSHGISECTGIQSMDFEEADISARSSLSNLISSHVESETLLIQADYGDGAGSSRGKITSKLSTDSLLEKSIIYDRWFDSGSCVLYSAVRISQADIQDTIRRIELERQNKLVNQRFFVRAVGIYNNKLAEGMQQLLIDSGVKRVTTLADANTYILHGVVASHEFLNQNKIAKVTIQLEIINPQKELIWTHQVVGKGVSFGGISKVQLLNKAIKQAIDDSMISIAEALQK